jgi:protein gp37
MPGVKKQHGGDRRGSGRPTRFGVRAVVGRLYLPPGFWNLLRSISSDSMSDAFARALQDDRMLPALRAALRKRGGGSR